MITFCSLPSRKIKMCNYKNNQRIRLSEPLVLQQVMQAAVMMSASWPGAKDNVHPRVLVWSTTRWSERFSPWKLSWNGSTLCTDLGKNSLGLTGVLICWQHFHFLFLKNLWRRSHGERKQVKRKLKVKILLSHN